LDFAAQGWQVAIHGHKSLAQAESLASEIKSKGGVAAVATADLRDPKDLDGLIAKCSERLGAPSCLVNNAAMFTRDELTDLEFQIWDAQFAVNLRAPVFLAKAFAAHLPPDRQGNIINMIDQRVWKPTPHFFSYSASKAALWGVTRTLAQALAPRIRVNAIGPGPVLKSQYQTDAEFRAQCEATILGRGTTPDEIAATVRYILAAPAMTGQMIALDGGQHLAWHTPDIDASPDR
jgi:NAD(P)-dependent dehydrogenase (short-subunit alcohol dehydrogenase family)